MDSSLIGTFVHFPDAEGNIHEGEIVAAWLEDFPEDPKEVRVEVRCTDHRFRSSWLSNCIAGSKPRAKKEDE